MIDIQSITTGLTLSQNGIWHSPETEDIAYPADGNDTCFAVEDNSFWFKHRNDCITALVTLFAPAEDETIFDIGGGNGVVSMALAKAGFNIILMEPGITGCRKARKRGLKQVIHATLKTAQFKAHSLPAVGLFDVIEHIKDDLSFLKSIKVILKKGGRLYATVPAHSFLWSTEDISAGHFRRYSLKKFSELLKTAGFQVEFSSYIFRPLVLPIFLQRSLPYRLGLSPQKTEGKTVGTAHTINNKQIERIINTLFQSEITNLTERKPILFGTSCVVVARNI